MTRLMFMFAGEERLFGGGRLGRNCFKHTFNKNCIGFNSGQTCCRYTISNNIMLKE